MKQTLFICGLSVLAVAGHTQNSSPQQTIELSISNPQPRLNETFDIKLDMPQLKTAISGAFAGTATLKGNPGSGNSEPFVLQLKATQKGTNEVGPLEFYVNGKRCTTNKLRYEVIDPLPQTDSGLWIRKAMTSDSGFCLIIEQRIPLAAEALEKADGSMTVATDPMQTAIARLRGVRTPGEDIFLRRSTATTSSGTINIKGTQHEFVDAYSAYEFKILDKTKKIRITAADLENIPAGYSFKEIAIN